MRNKYSSSENECLQVLHFKEAEKLAPQDFQVFNGSLKK